MSDIDAVGSLMMWSPTFSTLTQALCVFAVIVGSQAKLRRWVAVSSLTAPPLPEDAKDEAAKIPEPPKTGLRRIFNKETGAKISCFLLACTPNLIIWFVLPRIKNRMVLDGIYAVMFFAFSAAVSHTTLMLILSPETTIQYKPLVVGRGYALVSQAEQVTYVYIIASFALGAAGMASAFYGYTAWLPIAVASWVATSTATYTVPKFTMKYVVLLINGYILAVPILSLLIGVVMELFKNVTGGSDEPSSGSKDAIIPSDWLLKALTVLPSGLPTVPVGVMLALALRYDYSRSAPVALPAGAGEAVRIPRKVATFPRPTFNAGLIGLISTLIGLEVAAMHFPPGMPTVVEAAGIIFTVPAATIAMLLSVWRRGEVGSWWKYEERWVPKVEKDVPAKLDVEAAPASDDEKAPMLSAHQA